MSHMVFYHRKQGSHDSVDEIFRNVNSLHLRARIFFRSVQALDRPLLSHCVSHQHYLVISCAACCSVSLIRRVDRSLSPRHYCLPLQ